MRHLFKSLGFRQLFILIILLWALLLAPSVLRADLENDKIPIIASFYQIKGKNSLAYEINFSSNMIADKSIFYKKLSEEEIPFKLSRPMDLKVQWKNSRTLIIEPQISNRDFEDALDKKELDLIWKKEFSSKKNYELKIVKLKSQAEAEKIKPLIFSNARINTDGELYNRISLEPFKMDVQANSSGTTAQIKLSFNRLMMNKDELGGVIEMDEAPFSLNPPLDLKGRWSDQRTLVFKKTYSQKDFWEKVSDISFQLNLKPSFKNLHGHTLANKNVPPFYLSKFALIGFNQAKMNLDGWADFDIAFNKPVNIKDFSGGRLLLDKFVFEKGKTIAEDPESLAKSYQASKFRLLDKADFIESDGTVLRVQVKASHGERIRLRLNNIKTTDGRGLIQAAENSTWVDNFFTISDSKFEVEEQYPWRNYFTINVREEVNFDDIEKFISLDPPLDFTVSPYGQEGSSIQIFAPFSAEANTKIKLKKGLLSQRGVLTEDTEYTVVIPDDSNRRLMFTGRGRYLTPGKPLLLKLAGRNVKKLRLQAWRIYENNLATIINVQNYDQNTRMRLAQQFSKNILDRETETKAISGLSFERLIDLKDLLGAEAKGAYILRSSPVAEGEDEEDDYYYNRYDYDDYYYHTERYLPVMISDIGLSAHVLPNGVSVWANSLSAARPVGEAKVRFYDSANQVIVEGLTDENGLFSTSLDPSKLIFVSVEKGDDLNYLTFGSSARSSSNDEDYDYDDYYESSSWQSNGNAKWYGGDSGYLSVTAPVSSFAPMRDYLMKSYEAYLFMPRDMFKPGETVPIKAMIRDKDILPPKENFPVLWRIKDPDSKVLSSGKAELNQNGGLDFAAEIPFFAKTGSYSAEIYIPASSKVLGRANFTVEDFIPPRLALEVKAEEKIYHGNNPEINLQADVKYLFGAPGANLNWELDAVIFPTAFNPKGWEGFDFSVPASNFKTTRQAGAAKGRLDELGKAILKYHPGLDINRLPSKTSIEFVFSAQEDGGRWNAKKARVDYFPRNIILGTKSPEDPMVKESFNFAVAAVNPEGKASDKAELDIRVYKVKTRYFNSYRYGRHYRQATEELVEAKQERLSLKDGRAELAYTPQSAGAYEIHISDEDSGQLLKRRVYVYGLAAEKEALSEKAPVEISFDRPHYLPGEKAHVKIKSPFPGRLWLTVETSEILYSISRDMTTSEMELEIPVDSSLKTNAQVTASVIRPVAEKTTTFRAVGLASLEIDRSIYKLNISAQMPQRIKPSAKTKLKIKLSDSKGRPISGEASVALVDEGVLSLSNFKTPEPATLFLAGRNLLSRFYDIYDQLLPLELNIRPFLSPGGGDGLGRSGLFSPFKRNQEILSIFLPSVQIDENGEAEIELNIPEYSGQGRLMVVAASGDSFASIAHDILINRDLTAEATLPLALAPGDKFEIPVRMFLSPQAAPEAGINAEIKCHTEGPLKIIGENRASFKLTPGEGLNSFFRAVAEPAVDGGEQAGVGRLIIDSISGDGEAFSQTLELVVRPPYPRISKSVGTQTEGGKSVIFIDSSDFLKGTAEATITIAKSPAAESSRAVDWLRSYPYGCLEQTTSKAWPFVAAEDILQGFESETNTEKHIYYGLNTAAQRISSMQTASGGFAAWPGGNRVYDWGSVYAAHFLTEAGKQIELPKNLHERSLEWLKSYLSKSYSDSSEDAAYILSTKAYAVYVLALNGIYESGWYNTLKDRYDGLSPSARIFLAGAQALRDENANALIEFEKEKLDMSYNTLSYRRSSLDSGPRNLALKLLMWTEVAPQAETTKILANAVAEQGRKNIWSNTQENGLAALALGKYLDKSGLGKAYKAKLTAPDGKIILTAGPANMASVGSEVLAPYLDKKIKLNIEGEGRPYYTITVGGVPLDPPVAMADGLKLSRFWQVGENKIALSTETDLAEPLFFNKGDRVSVEIIVETSKPIQNLVLVDILPGGFEIENPRLVSPADDDDNKNTDINIEESHLEMREDRLVIIEPWINSGRTVYRYGLRAVSSGEYALPGTAAEGMYEPNRKAILAGGRVKVK